MTLIREHYRHKPYEKVISPYETCYACDGSGMGLNTYTGEPDNCWTCKGYGTLRARDERGRFVGNTSQRVDPLVNEVVGNLLVAAVESELSKILPDLGRDQIARIEESW